MRCTVAFGEMLPLLEEQQLAIVARVLANGLMICLPMQVFLTTCVPVQVFRAPRECASSAWRMRASRTELHEGEQQPAVLYAGHAHAAARAQARQPVHVASWLWLAALHGAGTRVTQ